MNISLPKHDFRIAVSWRLKKIFKLPALKFHAGPAGNKILCLYFLPPRLNGAVCHDFLRNFLRELLQDVDLQTRTHLWFMLDGAQPHFLLAFWEFLHNAIL
jgi:hypothetical protein